VVAELWEDFNDPSLALKFFGTKAWVDVTLDISANAAVSIDLFSSKTPVGIKIKGVAAGLVLVAELAFELEVAAEISTGFWVEIPDESFIELDLFTAALQDKKL
jgi:hypothetical protein